jgi:hypothetical protein
MRLHGLAAVVVSLTSVHAVPITITPPDGTHVPFVEIVGKLENDDVEVFRFRTSGVAKAIVTVTAKA